MKNFNTDIIKTLITSALSYALETIKDISIDKKEEVISFRKDECNILVWYGNKKESDYIKTQFKKFLAHHRKILEPIGNYNDIANDPVILRNHKGGIQSSADSEREREKEIERIALLARK